MRVPIDPAVISFDVGYYQRVTDGYATRLVGCARPILLFCAPGIAEQDKIAQIGQKLFFCESDMAVIWYRIRDLCY